MPQIVSPYKSKRRRRFPRLLLSVIGAYLIFRSISYLKPSLSFIKRATNIDTSIIPFNCRFFDHGDITSPSPNITSIFNCNSPSGRCKWYHPAKFFHPVCGVGSEYAYLLHDVEAMRLNSTLWHQMPPIIIEWVSLHGGLSSRQSKEQKKKQKQRPSQNKLDNQQQRHIFPRHNISMVHVHKTGGTSLVFAMGRIHNSLGYKGNMKTVYPPTGPIGILPRKYAKRRNATGKFLDGAVKYKSDWRHHEHTIFAVVRDPVERFISAIGQATGGRGSKSNSNFAHVLSQRCLKEKTPKATLTCFVRLVKNYGTWVEVHFTPMVVEISFSTMYKDIPVAVFPFNEVPNLLEELDADSNLKRKNGSAKGHRKSSMLTDMKIDDYEEESLKDLCDIYRMDVLFLWHLGYATRCDNFVSFT